MDADGRNRVRLIGDSAFYGNPVWSPDGRRIAFHSNRDGDVEIYVIDPRRCTECVGHFDKPQCQEVCPVDCIPLDPEWAESRQALLEKFHRLEGEKVASG